MLKSPQAKGKNYEREVAKDLSEKFNCKVMRTPCSGGISGFIRADLICMDKNSILAEYHFELKKCQSLNAHAVYWGSRAKAKTREKVAVIWKKNLDPEAIVVLGYNDFVQMMKELEELRKTQGVQV